MSGKEVSFTSKTEQKLGSRTFKFENRIVSQYGIAPKRMTAGKSGTVAVADWTVLDTFWPLTAGKTVRLNFEIFRTTRRDIGKAKPYLRGRSAFTATGAERIDVLGEGHDTIVLERTTYDEILAAKTPVKREIRYRIWWSRTVNWMVRMEMIGTSGGKTYRRTVTATKLVSP